MRTIVSKLAIGGRTPLNERAQHNSNQDGTCNILQAYHGPDIRGRSKSGEYHHVDDAERRDEKDGDEPTDQGPEVQDRELPAKHG